MEIGFVILFFGVLLAALATVAYLIATDRQRFLARFDLGQWRDGYYLRTAPNFLQSIYDHGFRSAWPRRTHALAAAWFGLRTWKHLRIKSGSLRRAFLKQHIVLFAVLEKIRPYVRDYVLHQQQRIISQRLEMMEDTMDRDRLVAYLQALRQERTQFFRSLNEQDRASLATIAERNLIAKLKMMHAVFQEHGFSLLPEFSQLRRWEELSGVELVQELTTSVRHGRKAERGSRELGV